MSESILKTLREEHRRIERIMLQIESTHDIVRKKELYLLLKDELIPHMEGEEKTIYAQLIEDVRGEEAEEVAQIAKAEHQEIKALLAQLDNLGIENEKWNAIYNEVEEAVRKHVEEEETEVFAEAKDDFTREELIDMGDEFIEAKIHIGP